MLPSLGRLQCVCVCLYIYRYNCVCFFYFLINIYEDFNNLPGWLEFLPPLVHSARSSLTIAKWHSQWQGAFTWMQRDLCKAKRKRSFPPIGIIEGRRFSSLSFLWDLQEAAAESSGGACSKREQVWEKNEWRQVSKEEAAVDDWSLIFWKRSFIKTNSCVCQKKKLLKSWTKKRNQSEWVAPGQQNFWIDCGILVTYYDVQNAHPTSFSPSSSLMGAKRMGRGCPGVCRDHNNFVQFVYLPLDHTSSMCTL